MRKRIILIDDEPMILALMKELLEDDPELEVAKITTTKEEFLAAVTQQHFDIAVIDISIGEREGGFGILKALKDKNITLPVVVLSAHDVYSYAPKCLQGGAKGYVGKDHICADLARGLKAVLNGNLFVSGDEGKHILEQYQSRPHVPPHSL